MSRVEQAQHRVARDRRLPIQPQLERILERAAERTNLNVKVTSGGQRHMPGKAGRTIVGVRTGSARHDIRSGHLGAADLELLDPETGRRLDLRNAADAARMGAFVEEAVALGATGVGAGEGYMGVHRIHIGGGSSATWGAGRGRPIASFIRNSHQRGTTRQRTERLTP